MTMSQHQRAVVLELVAQACGSEQVLAEPDLDLVEAGLLASLALVELLVGIEDRVGVEVPPTEVDRSELASVNRILEFVDSRLSLT